MKKHFSKKQFVPNGLLDTNQAGLELIRRFEAFRAEWYTDSVGVWTIGYGATEKHTPGLSRQSTPGPITKPEAERLLKRQLIQQYEPAVEEATSTALTANQFSALVSLCYNIGAANFRGSTLLRHLNAKRYQETADEFLRWKYADGEVLSGLVKRRKAERALFLEEPAVAAGMEAAPLEPLAVQPLKTRLPPAVNRFLRRF
jgi:lysozyme